MTKEKKQIERKRTLFQKIVNVFLYAGLVLFVILLIAFSFSQTSTFREILREKVVEEVNDTMNGKLSIKRIDGTIFTSLILRNTVIAGDQDTILNAEKIELRTSPLKLFFKIIYLRKLEISDAKVNLITDSNGELNVSKLFPPSEEEDTTSSEFPFKIQVADLQLSRINFRLQDYSKLESENIYDQMDLSDLRINNLNLALGAFADISSDYYRLHLRRLSFDPNFTFFELEKLKGRFEISTRGIAIREFNLVTRNSDVSIDATILDLNVFDSTFADKLGEARIDLSLTATGFNFDDLTTYIPATEILKGTVYVDSRFKGKLSDFSIQKLQVNYNETNLATSGRIVNLTEPDAMYISLAFYNAVINPPDISLLLPSIGLPSYENAGIVYIDTLTYEGNPLNFSSAFNLRVRQGNLKGIAAMDMRTEPMAYNISFETKNLDVQPFAGVRSRLNSKGTVIGRGFTPSEMRTKVNFSAVGSDIEDKLINNLNLSATASDKIISYSIDLRSDTASLDLKGDFDFADEQNPAYTLSGSVANLNIAEVIQDSSLQTNLNLIIDASGKGFDPENLDLFLVLALRQSSINGMTVDSTRAIADIRHGNGEDRVINLISDLADITISGKFSVTNTLNLITDEIEFLQSVFNEKYNEIFPEEKILQPAAFSRAESKFFTNSIREPVNLVYLVEFKDFELLSLFLGNDHLEVDGEITGSLDVTNESLSFSFNTNLDYLKYWGEEDVFFLSRFNLKAGIKNDFNSKNLEGVDYHFDVNVGRIFSGADIYDVTVNTSLKDNFFRFELSGKYEDVSKALLTGSADLAGNTIYLEFDRFNLSYNQFEIINRQALKFNYSSEKLRIEDVILVRNNGIVSIEGVLDKQGTQNLILRADNLRAADLGNNFSNLSPESIPDASINVEAFIKGRFTDPLIDVNINVDSISYQGKKFGYIESSFSYREKNLSVNLSFIDSIINATKPALVLNGSIPLNLTLEQSEDRVLENRPLDLTMKAEDFNLASLGDVIPQIKKLYGILNADLTIRGTIDDPLPGGSIQLLNAGFTASANNIEYRAGLKIGISKSEITVDSLIVENLPGTKDGGRIRGGGNIVLDNFELQSTNIFLYGDLKVLSENSRSASPSVYGDLVVSTRGNIEFISTSDRNYLKAPVTIKVANLTFPQTQGAYQGTSDNFVYKFVEDTITQSGTESDFESLIRLAESRNRQRNQDGQKTLPFDYEIDVRMDDEAKFTFVLSKEFNQNLVAILSGNLFFEMISGRQNAQGELKLLEGSTLQFFKSFEANGSIRFESEVSNPYLNITATYRDYYTPPDTTVNEIEIGVKIKLVGPLKELDRNFIQNKENIAVYYGAENIEKSNPDPSKDASDAVMFILTGKFVSEATPQDKSNAAGQLSGTATSLAGSLLGGFLNNLFGDYVRSVELRTVGSNTKFHITGRVSSVRYSVGGTTDVFQDISRANLRIEYPLYQNLLLRLERKESVTETSFTSEMVNELGLKYRFEF